MQPLFRTGHLGNTKLLFTEIEINTKETVKIEAPDKGTEITKTAYNETIKEKMKEMRDSRMARRRGR